MAGMSLLRPAVKQALRALPNNVRPVQTPLHRQTQLLGQVSVRNGGGANRMIIEPSRFEWRRFKDDLHFYVLLGLIPMAALVSYANLVIGPAELADIPEDYEPKEWEYHRSPIKRWFAKYVYETPQKEYEKTLHYLQIEADKRYWKQLEKKAQTLVAARLDYKQWYFVEVHKGVKQMGKDKVENDDQIFGN